jgi:hypothetical protein
LLRKSADPAASPSAQVNRDLPVAEPQNDGQIRQVLDSMMARSLLRDDKGKFITGAFKTGEHSEAFWIGIEPVKRDLVERVRQQLGVENTDGRETLLGVIDGYVEARLLRQSSFLRMCLQGGPVTNKGKTRGLLAAWGSFFDREMRAAERLGLVKVARRVQTPAEWLQSLDQPNANTEQEPSTDENPTPTA